MVTGAERTILESLENVWNDFLKLPVHHSADKAEFGQLINQLQNMIAAREGYRQIGWPIDG